ncbi:MAG: NUDIX domain-containing protein [Candidatus Paceibacterota bacterium]
MGNELASYQVSLKVLLKKDGVYLFLRDAESGFFDLPGGRINRDERNVPLEKILQREIAEEIGGNVQYKIDKPAFQYRASKDGQDIFITVYEAEYFSGEIVLSPDHNNIVWVDPKSFDTLKEPFLSQEGYAALINYFKK